MTTLTGTPNQALSPDRPDRPNASSAVNHTMRPR